MSTWRRCTLVCPDTAELLNRLAESAVRIKNVEYIDALTVSLSIEQKSIARLQKQLEKTGGSFAENITPFFLPWPNRLIKRPILCLGVMILLFLTLWLPERILFIGVEGNQRVSSVQILHTAGECGLVFGVERRAIRSEQIKNRLIEAIPALSWVGINTNGCKATIRVTEALPDTCREEGIGYSDLVAARDGVVLSSLVTSGTLMCREGQAVKRGQVLISGLADSGILLQTRRASGQVYALTQHKYTAVLPNSFLQKGTQTHQIKNYSLQIGKLSINLSKDSGILFTGYDRIYEESFVVLPGGFVLPVALVCQTFRQHEQLQPCADARLAAGVLAQCVDAYVLSHGYGRSILRTDRSMEDCADHSKMAVSYYCVEMIAKETVRQIVFEGG